MVHVTDTYHIIISFQHTYEDSFILDLLKSETFIAFSIQQPPKGESEDLSIYKAFTLSLELKLR